MSIITGFIFLFMIRFSDIHASILGMQNSVKTKALFLTKIKK